MSKGLFITIEGVEGAGKSTVVSSITKFMDDKSIPYIMTREPGGTPLAEELRQLLLTQRDECVEPITELLLMYAARVQHLNRVIKPSLDKGLCVICDRFNDSTFAYQGGGRGVDEALIQSIDKLTLDGFSPDLTLLLDLDVKVGLERAAKRGEKDRFEQEQVEFFNKVRACFLERARKESSRYRVIDANQSENLVRQCVVQIVEKFLQAKSITE